MAKWLGKFNHLSGDTATQWKRQKFSYNHYNLWITCSKCFLFGGCGVGGRGGEHWFRSQEDLSSPSKFNSAQGQIVSFLSHVFGFLHFPWSVYQIQAPEREHKERVNVLPWFLNGVAFLIPQFPYPGMRDSKPKVASLFVVKPAPRPDPPALLLLHWVLPQPLVLSLSKEHLNWELLFSHLGHTSTMTQKPFKIGWLIRPHCPSSEKPREQGWEHLWYSVHIYRWISQNKSKIKWRNCLVV